MPSNVASTIGPHSRRLGVDCIDGRTRWGKHARHVRRELVEMIGGNPTIAQSLLIDRAVELDLRCRMLAAEMAASPASETAFESERRYGWYANALARVLMRLGLERRTERREDGLDGLVGFGD